MFEERLQSLRNDPGKEGIKDKGRYEPKTTSSIHFTGRGQHIRDKYKVLGWLNAVAPQGGIPGWQRITFMRYATIDFEHPEQDTLWAYEGLVLPGGRMILGRWWPANHVRRPYVRCSHNMLVSACTNNKQNQFCGPFIMWAVDDPVFDDDVDSDNEE